MRRIICTILFLISAQWLLAQVSVSAALDSTQMLLGDQFKVHLNINYDTDVKIQKVDLSVLEEAEAIEMIGQTGWDTLRKRPEYVLQQDLTLMVFDSGAVFIPAIPFEYEQNGVKGKVETNELLIEVSVPELADTITLAPIKPIIEEPFNAEDLIPLAIVFGVIALIASLFFFIKRRGQEATDSSPPVRIPAHIIAMQKLKQLKSDKLWQQGKIKEYQSQLTFIVREYLEGRYQVQALESTTYEILDQLKAISFADDFRDRLKEMLELADLVKFAKAEPPIEAHDRLMGYAEDFVNQTQERVFETPDGEATSFPSEWAQAALAEKEGGEVTPINEELVLAGIVPRFLAHLIDFQIFHFIFIIVCFLIFSRGAPDGGVEKLYDNRHLTTTLYFIFLFTYYALMEFASGNTIGKNMMKVEVVDVDGEPLSMSATFMRTLVKVLSFGLLFLPYVTVFFNKDQQSLHDKAGKSLVVKRKRKS
ncbi:MAG: RDD family protein [Bacteroidota bacterium]